MRKKTYDMYAGYRKPTKLHTNSAKWPKIKYNATIPSTAIKQKLSKNSVII